MQRWCRNTLFVAVLLTVTSLTPTDARGHLPVAGTSTQRDAGATAAAAATAMPDPSLGAAAMQSEPTQLPPYTNDSSLQLSRRSLGAGGSSRTAVNATGLAAKEDGAPGGTGASVTAPRPSNGGVASNITDGLVHVDTLTSAGAGGLQAVAHPPALAKGACLHTWWREHTLLLSYKRREP
jgi:hypothetical protein